MYQAREGEKRGESFEHPLLKITSNVIYEDLHVREKAVVVIDFGPHCPRNESIFLAFLVRRLPSSGDVLCRVSTPSDDNDNSRGAAVGRTQSQGMLLEAPHVAVPMDQHGLQQELLCRGSGSDSLSLGPGRVLSTLAQGPAGISTALESSMFSQLPAKKFSLWPLRSHPGLPCHGIPGRPGRGDLSICMGLPSSQSFILAPSY